MNENAQEVAICELIRQVAVQKYGSQSEAAKAWGVSKFMVSKVVNGHRTPSRIMLRDVGLTEKALPC